MGDYNNDRSGGGYRGGGGFSRGGGRGGFSRGGRSSFGGGGRSFGGGRSDGPREMFDAVCDNCGKNCQVPLRPTQGKPVYCSDCFEKMGGREDRSSSGDRPRFEDRSPRPQAQGGVDLGAINAKLDKILSILEPKNVVEVASTPKTVKLAEVVDLPKIKKAVKKVTSEKKD